MNSKIALTESSHDAATWFRGFDRRSHRRHDLMSRDVIVESVKSGGNPDSYPISDAVAKAKKATKGKTTTKTGTKTRKTKAAATPAAESVISLGNLVDLSARGIRIRVDASAAETLRLNTQVTVRVELPTFAGISAFIDRSGPQIRPTRTWTGTMTVVRVIRVGKAYEIGGRLEDIDALDQGMLSLYLSTQPLAA